MERQRYKIKGYIFLLSVIIGCSVFVEASKCVEISIPHIAEQPDTRIAVPINIDNTTGVGIISLELTLEYDPDILTATSVSILDSVPSVSGWVSPIYRITDGQIIVWMADFDELIGEGILLRANFAVSASADHGDVSQLTLSGVYFNEGSIPVSTTDGLFTVDSMPPETVANISGTPGDNGWYISDVEVELSATDVPSGVMETKYRINDGLWETYGGPFQISGSTVYYYSEDNAGNIESQKQVEIKIDKLPPSAPSLYSYSHSEDTWSNDDDIAFGWDQPSDDSGIGGYSYILDHSPFTIPDTILESTSTSKSYIGVDDGVYYFHVRSKDGAGNWGDTDHFGPVKIDDTIPTIPEISSSTHVESVPNSNNDPAFDWSEPPDASGIVGYSYELDHSSTTIPDTTSEGSDTPKTYSDLIDGTWYFHVRAEDGAGNWGTTDHFGPIIIATAGPPAPEVSSSTHAEDVWNNNDNPCFEWTEPSDPNGIDGYSYNFDNSPSTIPDEVSEGTDLSVCYPNTPDGIWYFHVRARNGSEVWGDTAHYGPVKIDTTPPPQPNISSSGHTEDTWNNNNDPCFEWSELPDTSGIAGYSYELDHSSGTIPDEVSEGTDLLFCYSNVSDGIWYFHLRAQDSAGNWGVADHYGPVKVDTGLPSVPVISSGTHEEDVWSNNDNPIFDWSEPEDPSGIIGYSYVLDNSSNTIPDNIMDGTDTSESYSSMTDGIWYFHVCAQDGAGNWGDVGHFGPVKIDTIPPLAPEISSDTHVESAWSNDNSPSFNWTIPPELSGIAGYSYEFDDSPVTIPDSVSEGTDTTVTYSDVEDGFWYFHVLAKDGAGNWGDTDHYGPIKINTTGSSEPEIFSSTHPEDVWSNIDSPCFEWTEPIDPSGIAGYSYELDIFPSTVPDTIMEGADTSRCYSGVSDGIWYFHVRAKNNADNWGNAAHYGPIKIDTELPSAPDISSETHAEDEWSSNNDPSFAWTEPVDDSGIAGYSYELDGSPDAIPDTISEGTDTTKTYYNVNSGIWYFHVRAEDNAGNWGNADHYGPVKIGVPDIAITPEMGCYGYIPVGNYSDKKFTISNPGTAPLRVTGIDLTGSDDYSIQNGEGGFDLNPGQEHDIIVRFTPSGIGSKVGTLRIANEIPEKNPLVVVLCGTGTMPDALIIQAWCPIDLQITDPQGQSISATGSSIPNASYIEMDINGDGDPDDEVIIPNAIVGDYSIQVMPEAGAMPDDTYTMSALYKGQVRMLAEYVSIQDMPVIPYAFTISLVDEFSRDLQQGWNLISLPLQPSDPAPGAVLASIAGMYDSIWAYDLAVGWLVYTPGAPSDLNILETGKGYWIKMDQPGTLVIEGMYIEETGIFLQGEAWNLVGYNCLEPKNAEDCMSGVADSIDSVWEYNTGTGWLVYAPGGASDLEVMRPGYGYWVKADQNCTWDVNHGTTTDTPRMLARWESGPSYPDLSLLHQSYPNPFNPDTWIPYQLKDDTEVLIRIYTLSGQLVRELDLGHKPAGFYISREKAAYWDGKNEASELVSSGVYFYTIQAGEFTATKKMVIAR